jgi:hypothetical protein
MNEEDSENTPALLHKRYSETLAYLRELRAAVESSAAT